MSLRTFHPLVQHWFREQLGDPTEPQRLGWPKIAAGQNTLIAAPTGSGKTLAAFLVCLDDLLRQWLKGKLDDRVQVVYVSPLKALSNDIHRNLEVPLAQINQIAIQQGNEACPIRTMVRTGDTPASERQKMLRKPPHILVTTPESLYLLLTSAKARDILTTTQTVIIDEIHALARDKRGSHLTLTLERLSAICPRRPVRIGLSATQRPIDEIGRFLVGVSDDSHSTDKPVAAPCEIVDIGHARQLELGIEVPPSKLAANCSHEQWTEIYQRLEYLIGQHRSTLIFVNTRRMAERVAHRLTESLGNDAVASHHGSLSREIRLDAEQRLKSGSLRAIVATASLEMGIDVGYIDLVCQLGSPRSIATFLQRVGRSGHSLGKIPRGRLFPVTRDELIECIALVAAVRGGRLDQIEIPVAPIDILAQQIIATVASEDWNETELFSLCRRAWPYRNLTRDQFDSVLKLTSEGISHGSKRGAHLHRDIISGRVRARRGARLAALTSGGAIPETADYRVVAEPDNTHVGTVDEDFAIESLPGDVFLLGATSWRICHVRGGEVTVQDAQGAPPSIPFWFGEAPGRTRELSDEISQLRQRLANENAAGVHDTARALDEELAIGPSAAEQAVRYIHAGQEALGVIPTTTQIVFERFFDESGGMQLVIHSPWGARINRAWGLALRKRFCRSFDFELQASADDNGIVLALSPQHSFPIESLFKMIGPHNAQTLLEQSLLAVPMFSVRWRWNITRSLAVLRHQGGRRVPPYLQRFQSDDLLAAVFPEQVGCLENHHGDVKIPNHPLVQQTIHDCFHEAMDFNGWLELLEGTLSGQITLVARDTREPSPLSEELLNANPYAFLDPAPLEERRTRAVRLRRTLSTDDLGDLGHLDANAVSTVQQEAWPRVRDTEELHDALHSLVAVSKLEMDVWLSNQPDNHLENSWIQQLVDQGRATKVMLSENSTLWAAAERLPLLRALYPNTEYLPDINLPDSLQQDWSSANARVELVRGRVLHSGPIRSETIAKAFHFDQDSVQAALEALEADGTVLRGHYLPRTDGDPVNVDDWCDRRLLARIHRMTIDGLRRQIQPVTPKTFLRFLIRHHRIGSGEPWGGAAAVREVVGQLQGFQMSAGAWEQQVLASRIHQYDSQWLDQLFQSGELIWGRLRPPRRDDRNGPSRSMMTRSVPITIQLRNDLSWLLPNHREITQGLIGANARQVLEAMRTHGALFFQEILAGTGLLATQLEEALRELAALGLVTSDGLASLRHFVDSRQSGRNTSRHRQRRHKPVAHTGRWSPFPGFIAQVPHQDRCQQWCWQLLRRYGVVFRDLLIRENVAPIWSDLVNCYRQLERRGEIRGGRFVSDVSGEQFATEEALRTLRQLRDEPPQDDWVVLSAADPLNLVGIVSDGPRITASHTNSLILENGKLIAVRQATHVSFLVKQNPATTANMTRALVRCRRDAAPETHIRNPKRNTPEAT